MVLPEPSEGVKEWPYTGTYNLSADQLSLSRWLAVPSPNYYFGVVHLHIAQVLEKKVDLCISVTQESLDLYKVKSILLFITSKRNLPRSKCWENCTVI